VRGRLSRVLVRQKGLCRWCGQPVPKGRHSWCSDGCVTEFQIEAWPQVTRKELTKRDHEICRLCDRDCGRIARYVTAILDAPAAVRQTAWSRSACAYREIEPDPVLVRRRDRWIHMLRRLRLLSSEPWDSSARLRHLWEADHMEPVCWGGHNGLDNYRTLCRPCHRAETARLARARAAAKRVG
jgi:5-methylcytosine-specific restriction endonuclease McrA